MVIIKEFRVVLPLTVDEYKIGQLYTVSSLSKNETGGGDGVEVLQNEPYVGKPLFNGQYSEGQYTKKRYIGKKKVNGIIRTLLPDSALIGTEDAWNAYPYCRTVITNEFMGEDFIITIESLHLPGKPEIENAHMLPPDKLEKREVVIIDIAADLPDKADYKAEEDPAKYRSKKTNRGPLKPNWMQTAQPIMTCYKLVTVKFKWFGLQGFVEKKIQKAELRLFTIFHRQVFCLLDEWYGLTIEDIRRIETQTQEELKDEIKTGAVKGLKQNE